LQHDLGHLSVFQGESFWNHTLHHFVIGVVKGASSSWWNHRHFRHHAKPNIASKDPDIQYVWMFQFGKSLPVSWGKKKLGFMPYQFQHLYWWFFGPPFVLPFYFHVEILVWVFRHKRWVDLLCIVAFIWRFIFTFSGVTGGAWAVMKMYFFARLLESHWFVWVTQMNHLPMDIDGDQKRDWLTLQVKATCDVEGSLFNDWFTGHLNYQVEHHLFPTMPRCNLPHVAGRVRALCEKHNLNLETKSLFGAFADIVVSLRESGQLWYDAYYHK